MTTLSTVGSSTNKYSHSMVPGTTQEEIQKEIQEKRSQTPPEYEQFQGTFATQEYIQACIKHDPSDIARIITLPPNHDMAVWQYESLRQILLDLNGFVHILGEECTANSCPKMCATENWVFLCAAHVGKPPKECCAIDYILHTLTSFSLMVTSTESFPNRYTISAKSAQQFANMARRLYRVFAHAYYHHREVFDQIESRTHLTRRFLEFSLKYELMTSQQLTPPLDL